MNKQTARELLDVIVNDINELDLTDYHAIFQLGNIANSLTRVIDVVGNEIFNKSDSTMEKISYYTSCENCENLTGTATVLEGIGDYDRDGNTLYGADCTGCGNETVIENWLDDEEGESN